MRLWRSLQNLTWLERVFYGGLLVLPFIVWPSAPLPYEVPKVFFLYFWVSGLVGLSLLEVLGRRELYLRMSRLARLVIFFSLTAIIASVFGEDLHKSMWGNFYRADGLITLFFLICVSGVVGLTPSLVLSRKFLFSIAINNAIINLLLLASFIRDIFVTQTLETFFQDHVGTFGNENFLAGYLLITLPSIFYFAQTAATKSRKRLWIFFSIVTSVMILLTQSWGAILGLILFLMLSNSLSKRKKLAVGVVGVACLAGMIYVYALYTSGQGFVAGSRGRIFTKLALSVQERPLLGWGWANVDHAFNSIDWPFHLEHDVYVDKAHSQLLEVLVTTGVGGLAIYVALLLLCLLNLQQAKLYAPLAEKQIITTLQWMFLLYLFHSQTNVISINEELLFWLIVGSQLQLSSAKPKRIINSSTSFL